ncbi:uncharacterized protein PV07_04220 [Cladophialophora immunda]|uniref:N-acetyltransferase domain-containing protein n=1 Tax=Cladophialophora immunda TaxID=569365 RepID=A0A0D1ZX04_9EURO|nr:uncharacterized protein PV07_04220 [Cladophialophora immunda]KIW32691.1 hypothetical protein PV07_04220 [Cladophialophora immunda]OQU95252.1 hypothetical protein CLAIMM_01485 [Cladophialophora immunda]
MRLTDPIRLSLEDADAVAPDIASIRHSSLTSTPLGQLRYGAVPHAEAREWLESCSRLELQSELRYPRIASFERDGSGQHVTRMEHLVVRDLDLAPFKACNALTIQGDAVRPGRVVAYAEFQYHPPQQEPAAGSVISGSQRIHASEEGFSSEEPATVLDLPVSVHRDLHEHWDRTVEAALSARFGHMHCFEVRGIGTLAPSHLRKGIASSLLAWIFPWADALGVPVVLAATPAGHPFYLRHGFVEVDDDDDDDEDGKAQRRFIECDMADWGGTGVHRHVLMIRWPKHAERNTA